MRTYNIPVMKFFRAIEILRDWNPV